MGKSPKNWIHCQSCPYIKASPCDHDGVTSSERYHHSFWQLHGNRWGYCTWSRLMDGDGTTLFDVYSGILNVKYHIAFQIGVMWTDIGICWYFFVTFQVQYFLHIVGPSWRSILWSLVKKKEWEKRLLVSFYRWFCVKCTSHGINTR